VIFVCSIEENKEAIKRTLKGRFPGMESMKKDIGDVLRQESFYVGLIWYL
jgi:hypothetical protein